MLFSVNCLCQAIKIDQLDIEKAPDTLFIHKEDSKFVCFNIFVKNFRNPSKKPGLPHFMEHMIFDSSKDLPMGELDTQVETLGATTDGMTSYDFTLYRITVKEENLDKAVSLMAASIFNPLFTDNDIKIEKEIIADEFAKKDFISFEFVKNRIYSDLFGKKTEYGNSLEGDVSLMTRDDCVLYHEMNYFPENMVIVVSGNLEKQKIIDIVKKYFTSAKEIEKFAVPADFNEKKNISEASIEDFYGVGLNFAPAYLSGEAIVCSVLAEIIYGKSIRYARAESKDVKSRMYYSVQNWASPFVMTFKSKDVSAARNACMKAVADVKEGKIEPWEIDFAKNKIVQDFITRNQNMDTLTYQIGQMYIRYGFQVIGEYTYLVNSVSKEDLSMAVQKYVKGF